MDCIHELGRRFSVFSRVEINCRDIGKSYVALAIQKSQQLDFTQAKRGLAIARDFDRVAEQRD